MANNIQVSNVSTTGQNTTAGTNNSANYTMVKFNVSWENSWRTSSGPSNWDAAWVFVKFMVGSHNPVVEGASSIGTTVTVSSTANLRAGMPVVVSSGTGTFAANTVISSISSATQFVVSATPTVDLRFATITCQRIWEHASLDATANNHTAPAGSTISVPSDSTGVFIYRNADGTGNVSYPNVQLRWQYGINGVADDEAIQVQVFAIEMVYVPQGSFYVGSGGVGVGSNGNFTDGPSAAFGTAVLSGSSVGSVTINEGGANYTSAPTVLFIGGGGGGAAATTTITNGVVTSITVTNGGSNYTSSPTVNIDLPPSSVPFQITSEAALGIDNAAGKLWTTATPPQTSIGSLAADPEATLAAAFPKGFAAFYCMKYEITQGEYRDFLNTLTRTQQNTRTLCTLSIGTTSVTNRYVMSNTSSISNRNGIRCDATISANQPIVFYCDLNGNGIGNEAADGEWIPCNWINMAHGSAYLDWAGLRPMTELEYEKACRGTQAPVLNEYAWGSTSITEATGISNGGANNETFSNAGANCAYNNNANVQGPLRVGAFAGGATTREQAGATYYGIMEMSGNLWEWVIGVAHANGRAFTGVHGNGRLSADGIADQTSWPELIMSGSTGGSGRRGGAYDIPFSAHRVSSRGSVSTTITGNSLNGTFGFRGVRTFP
jgi:formylglycine-generating enzyme required for sulfatase activity